MYKIQGVKDRQWKMDKRLGDSCREVKVQSEEVSLQAAAEKGQQGSRSYGDGEVIPPLGS